MAGRPKRRARQNSIRFSREKGGKWGPEDQYDLDAMAAEKLTNGAPRYYFHLHDVLKVGVSPHNVRYYVTTPLGVYGYPLTPEYLFLLRGKGDLAKIPTFMDRKYVSLLEAVQPDKMLVIRREDVWGKTQSGEERIGPISKDARREMKRNPSLNLSAFRLSPEMARERKERARRRKERDAKPFYIYSRVKRGIVPPSEPSTFGTHEEEWDVFPEPTPEEMAEEKEVERKRARRQPIRLSQDLCRLGYTSVVDLGTSSIHKKEPSQIVFLVPQAYKVRGTSPLPKRRARRNSRSNPLMQIPPALIEAVAGAWAEAEGVAYLPLKLPLSAFPYWENDVGPRAAALHSLGPNPVIRLGLMENKSKGTTAEYHPPTWVSLPLARRKKLIAKWPRWNGSATVDGGKLLLPKVREAWQVFAPVEHELSHMVQFIFSGLLNLFPLGKEPYFGQAPAPTGWTMGDVEMQPSLSTLARSVVGAAVHLNSLLALSGGAPLSDEDVEHLAGRAGAALSGYLPPAARRRAVTGLMRGVARYWPRNKGIADGRWKENYRARGSVPAAAVRAELGRIADELTAPVILLIRPGERDGHRGQQVAAEARAQIGEALQNLYQKRLRQGKKPLALPNPSVPQFGPFRGRPKTRPGGYAVILRQGKLLVSQTGDKYHLPGGGIEKGETPEEATSRETMEETGYQITGLAPLGRANQYMERSWSGKPLNKLGHFFLGQVEHRPRTTRVEAGHVPMWVKVRTFLNGKASDYQKWAVSQAVGARKNPKPQRKANKARKRQARLAAQQRPPKSTKRVTPAIWMHTGLESEKPGGSKDYPGYSHLEVRLHQRLGVPISRTRELSGKLLALIRKYAPEKIKVYSQGGTSRALIPIPGFGAAQLWYIKNGLWFRTWFPAGSEVGLATQWPEEFEDEAIRAIQESARRGVILGV
jgi:8-oxo-dGTP diphosphatase